MAAISANGGMSMTNGYDVQFDLSKNSKLIIKENVFFPKEFKSSALSILQEQYSQLLTLKKSIVS